MSSQHNDLFQLRNSIEKMTKFNQIAVLRILNSFEDVIINENRNGIHINLSELSEEVINKLQEYANYVNTQETTLNQDEKQKEDIKNIYFS
tara:strand:- start:1173 stop:1445 length:273 start_codon:yes stop_codon:yes gene_type:complete